MSIPSLSFAQQVNGATSTSLPEAPSVTTPQAINPEQPQNEEEQKRLEREKAKKELSAEEHQHVLGVVPYFNIVNGGTAAPLSPGQKFDLAFKNATNPFVFVSTGLIAGLSQEQNTYPDYGQGTEGYAKRYSTTYADLFDGKMIGKAIFPAILHQDPRYYRMGTGGFQKRLWYSVSTVVRAKGDNGKWQPGYSNILGNFVAGAIANLYYPASDRGAILTFERGSIVTAEGAFGGIIAEFLPDIQRFVFHKKNCWFYAFRRR